MKIVSKLSLSCLLYCHGSRDNCGISLIQLIKSKICRDKIEVVQSLIKKNPNGFFLREFQTSLVSGMVVLLLSNTFSFRQKYLQNN